MRINFLKSIFFKYEIIKIVYILIIVNNRQKLIYVEMTTSRLIDVRDMTS